MADVEKVLSVGLRQKFYIWGRHTSIKDKSTDDVLKWLKHELTLEEFLNERHSTILMNEFISGCFPDKYDKIC